MIPAPAWTPTNDEYHADHSRWSPSMLKLFAEDPYTAFRRYILGEPNDEPPSVPMVIGSAVNTLLLESGLAAEIYVVEVDGRGAKAYKEARATYPERLVMTRKEFITAQGVAGAILDPRTRSAEVARALLCGPGGYSEWAHHWVDSFGVRRKCKIDRLAVVNGAPCVIELKTTSDPDPAEFRWHADRMNYDLQAASNLEGVTEAMGEAATATPPGFIFVVVGSEDPFSCAVLRAGASLITSGQTKLDTRLADLARALPDTTGALWAHAWERLDDNIIPTLEAPRKGQ